MRLLMYVGDKGPSLGALRGEAIIDLGTLAAKSGDEGFPTTLLGLIDMGPDGLKQAAALVSAVGAGQEAGNWSRPLSGTTLLPPLHPPRGSVLAIGRNYQEHAEESARSRGEEVAKPTVFSKAHTSVFGPYDDIPLHPDVTSQVDWEVELGVVIGREGVNIPREQALEHVFGYTVINDISARDVQFGWGGQFFKGKSLDGFCPTGPWVVTADEIPDPQDLWLRLRVNGVLKQEANTSDMILPVDELISQLSLGMTLVPGALIATGTPAGVGMGRTPPEYLKAGDIVESEIDRIGSLRNRMVS
jgi:2-keto-4-pentenoate hydratase/2-oxohepta-3-ene-1,7-dioic acid hydratase in catechol pathway